MTTPNPIPDDGSTAEALARAAAAEAAKAAPNPPLEIVKEEPKPEPKPDDKKPAAKEDAPDTFSYKETGDAGLDMALDFIGKQGYGPEHPSMQAAINGDFSLLEAELASKDVKGYSAYIKLAQKAYDDISVKTKTRMAADQAAVEGAVGGKEQWAAIQKWAGENADDDEKAVLKEMLGKGGKHAIMAATFLNHHYSKTPAADTIGSGARPAEARGAAGTDNSALSPADYGREVNKLRSAGIKGDIADSPQYKALQERRLRYRG